MAVKKLQTDTDDVAFAYIENAGFKDNSGSITQSGHTIAQLLEFNEYYPKG